MKRPTIMSLWAVSIGTEFDTFPDAYKKQFKLAFLHIRERVYHFVTQKLWNVESGHTLDSNIVTACHGIHVRTSQDSTI
jgi:hypothetical protein